MAFLYPKTRFQWYRYQHFDIDIVKKITDMILIQYIDFNIY